MPKLHHNRCVYHNIIVYTHQRKYLNKIMNTFICVGHGVAAAAQLHGLHCSALACSLACSPQKDAPPSAPPQRLQRSPKTPHQQHKGVLVSQLVPRQTPRLMQWPGPSRSPEAAACLTASPARPSARSVLGLPCAEPCARNMLLGFASARHSIRDATMNTHINTWQGCDSQIQTSHCKRL